MHPILQWEFQDLLPMILALLMVLMHPTALVPLKGSELLRTLVPLMRLVLQQMYLLAPLRMSPMDHLPILRVARLTTLLVSHKGFEAEVIVVHNTIATIIQLCGMRKQDLNNM
jgi:hypothetical protein